MEALQGERSRDVRYFTGTAAMYVCDGFKILVTSPRGVMKVPKKDAIRLASICLATQKKYVLVDLKRYNKDLRELAALRLFLGSRRR